MKKYFIGIKWKDETTPFFHLKDFYNNNDEYIVSISMNYDRRLVFWDIQTPKGKAKILRR